MMKDDDIVILLLAKPEVRFGLTERTVGECVAECGVGHAPKYFEKHERNKIKRDDLYQAFTAAGKHVLRVN